MKETRIYRTERCKAFLRNKILRSESADQSRARRIPKTITSTRIETKRVWKDATYTG